MGRSPGFGSTARNLSPFRTRFRSGSGCRCLNLATPQSLVGSFYKRHAVTPLTRGSDRPEAHGFRLSFTPLAGVLFTVPSRYWFTIGRLPVFSLGPWSALLPTGFRVSGGTHAHATLSPHAASPTGLSPPPVARSSSVRLQCLVPDEVPAGSSSRLVQPPTQQRRQPRTPTWFGLLPVRSPLLRESSLFLGVLRCFSSPGAPPPSQAWSVCRSRQGLPHSEISGSPAASASPEHFAAWPRPSSA